MGAGSAVLGWIEGVSDGLSGFAKLFSGLYSDRLQRRKPLAVLGYFLTALGIASFGLATKSWQVFLGRVVAWTGRGARTPVRNVLLTEATTPQTYGRAFGLERAMDTAGAVLGPVLAIILLRTIGLQKTFLCTFIPGMLAMLVMALMVKERPHEAQTRGMLASLKGLPKGFRTYLVGVGIAGCGDFSNTLLILWAVQAWTAHLGLLPATGLAIRFYVLYNVVYSLSCYFSGHLADLFPKHRVLAAGYALAVIPAGCLLCPGDSVLKFGLVFAISGLYMGVWETLESSTAAELLPEGATGAGFGALATVNGMGDLISSVVVGSLWAVLPAAAMGWVIATSLIGAGVIAFGGSPSQESTAYEVEQPESLTLP